MGIDSSFGLAFSKSQLAAGDNLAEGGTVFFSVADRDKPAGLEAAARFVAAGFTIAATIGTAQFLENAGVPVGTLVAKILTPENAGADAGEPNAVGVMDALELIRSGKVHLVVNTPRGRGPRRRGVHPASGPPVQGPARHDGRRRQGGRRRRPRAGRSPVYGHVAPGTPRGALTS